MMRQTHEYRKPGRLLQRLRRTGMLNKKNMFWSWYEPHNFGDWIGPYLFEKITGKSPHFCPTACPLNVRYFTAAGSIMRHIKVPDTAIVWGSGIINAQDIFERPYEICAVRGPFTRDRCIKLGFSCPEIYGDPAILMSEYYTPRPSEGTGRVGLIPHFTHLEDVRAWNVKDAEVIIIDVTKPIEDVIDAIASCDATASSSLHGLILSHTYGVPSAWIEISQPLMGDNIKFADYYSSGGVYPTPTPFRAESPLSATQIKKLALSMPMPNLSALRAPLMAACPFRKSSSLAGKDIYR